MKYTCRWNAKGLECIQGRVHICALDLVFDWDWNVHKSRVSERAAFAYIMSDGVLFCTYLQRWCNRAVWVV
jgi:hypothetical protein